LKSCDVDFVYAKAAGDRFSALPQAGSMPLLNPHDLFQGDSLGFSNLGDIEPYMKMSIHRLGRQYDWAAKNRNRSGRLLPATIPAASAALRSANKEAAVEILVKHASRIAETLERAYDFLVAKLRSFARTATSRTRPTARWRTD